MAQSSPTSPKRRETRQKKGLTAPSIMSSSRGRLTEELQCSICLDVFTDPVSTPCGHNFCKTCLNKCWDNSRTCSCPYCKETFSQRPDLKINITLREVLDHYKKKTPNKNAEVLCDICEERKLKALKSCVVCQSSYCETHLEHHLRVAGLKKHKLMEPVSNLEEYICQTHERPLELFCRDDQTCLCTMCALSDHKNHNTVPLEEESEEKKAQLMKTQKDVQQMIREKINKIKAIKLSAEVRKRNTKMEKAARVEFFTDLIRSIERCQTEQLEMMEEQQKAAEKQENELIKELELKISELKMRNTELEQLSHTDDALHLLRMFSSLCIPTNTRNWPEISMKTDVSLETLRRALTQLQHTLDEKFRKTKLKRMQQYAESRSSVSSGHNSSSAADALVKNCKLSEASSEFVTGSYASFQESSLADFVQEFVSHLYSSPGSFESEINYITDTLNSCVTTEETLQELVELIYIQSTSIPHFTYTGARLCNHLSHHIHFNPASGNFRQLLLKRCQSEYEQREQAVRGDPDTQKKFHSYVLFLGELYINLEIRSVKNKPGRANVLLRALKDLLITLFSHPKDPNLMCAVKLLKLTGSVLEDTWKEKGQSDMDEIIKKIKYILLDAKCSRDVRTMLLKLVELRSSNWGRVHTAAVSSYATPDNDPNYFMNEPTSTQQMGRLSQQRILNSQRNSRRF
ncbi:E3 ubiquitin-protein ligase TRIM8-like [Carassius auratus]|uniref:Polyadenylate-binding protein-interacting protein 1 n=1 Tax=Carassius auratus TaxID=7957 RepID=A0A6P6MII5_CARAU|nr:E3 ubiquitin-protein ligase TRIM8-like [Carassius auratus]